MEMNLMVGARVAPKKLVPSWIFNILQAEITTPKLANYHRTNSWQPSLELELRAFLSQLKLKSYHHLLMVLGWLLSNQQLGQTVRTSRCGLNYLSGTIQLLTPVLV